MAIPQNRFPKYAHSPFTFVRDGVKTIVEADGKMTIRQKNIHDDDDDVIDTSAKFVLKLHTMLKAERPFEFRFRDITARFETKKITLKQKDEDGNFDEIITTDNYIIELTNMLRATRSVEYIDAPYKAEEDSNL